MTTTDFSTTMLVSQTPEEVFNAVNNVRGWWSETLEGETHQLNDEFVYRHNDIHYSRQKLVEIVPAAKVVWLVTDSSLSFVKNKSEWNGTKIVFDISHEGDKTLLTITHIGLVPEIECFDGCSKGWTYYLHESLYKLITTGKGQPDLKKA